MQAKPLSRGRLEIVWLACLFLLAPVGLGGAVAMGWVTLPPSLPATSALLIMLVAAPIIEELVFRGHIQPRLTTYIARGAHADSIVHAAAITATSLAFTALHWLAIPTSSSLWVMLPSIALGALQAKTGRWELCAVFHSSFNAIWCVAIWLQRH